MNTVSIFLPGSFEDAQLYMGHLVLFTTDRAAQLVELEPLMSRLETRYPDWRGLLTIMFARNDWLTGGVVSSLARNELLRRALNDATEKLAGSDLELERSDVDLMTLTGYRQGSNLILDTVFYGSRLYLGTTSGLFDYDIDWQRLAVTRSRQRIDARCVSAAAEYGAINASCEGDGLFTAYDEFGWRHAHGNGTSI